MVIFIKDARIGGGKLKGMIKLVIYLDVHTKSIIKLECSMGDTSS